MKRNLIIKIIIGLICVLFIIFLIINPFTKNKEKEEIDYIKYEKKGNLELTLNGDYVEYQQISKKYKEKGIKATADGLPQKDINIRYIKNNRAYSFVDTEVLGNYLVTYTVVNPFDKDEVKSINRVVIIVDTKKPKITVPEKQTIKTTDVKDFNPKTNVTVTDNSGSANLTYENTLKEEKGTYVITYTATDKSGNKSTKKRLIKVID